MMDNDMLKKYMKKDEKDRGGLVPDSRESEKEFADLLGRISGKVKDLQSEIDGHDRLKRKK